MDYKIAYEELCESYGEQSQALAHYDEQLKKLVPENQRLREALEEISKHAESNCGAWCCKTTADKALAETEIKEVTINSKEHLNEVMQEIVDDYLRRKGAE